jgi:hypothetical protein
MIEFCVNCGGLVAQGNLLCERCLKIRLQNTLKKNGLLYLMP